MALIRIDADLDSRYIKSYATEENLLKAIEQQQTHYPECKDRFIVVKTPAGRWTAIVVLDKSVGGYVGRYDFLKV